MIITKSANLRAGSDIQDLFDGSVREAGFHLTVDDRVGIERLLQHRALKEVPNPPLLAGLLRHKLRISRSAPEPTLPELVVAGRLVTYMISGEGARNGVLSMSPTPMPGHILVASLLGATLIGMRKMQKMPLLRNDGQIATIVVLDVSPSPEHTAA